MVFLLTTKTLDIIWIDVKIITMKIEIPTNKTRKSSILLSFLLNKSNNLKPKVKHVCKELHTCFY